MDEAQKTDYVREREQLLLEELVELVNERDMLVHQMDEENQRMDEEQEIAKDVCRASFRARGNQPLLPPPTTNATLPAKMSNVGLGDHADDKNCSIQ